MFAELKKDWRVFEQAPPGDRFERLYEARQKTGGWSRIVLTVLGVVLLAGGIVLLFIPGPGILLIAFGGALIAQQSLWLARLLDRLELVLRKLARKAKAFWRRASVAARAGLVAGAAVAGAGAAYVGYLWLFKR